MARFAQYVLHEHRSEGKAGLHMDLRIKIPFPVKGNNVESWALPKNRIPNIHERVLAIRGHRHPEWWLTADNYRIEEGYGKGFVKIIQKGRVEVLGWNHKQITFIVKGRVMAGKFVLIYPAVFKAQDITRKKKNPKAGEQWLLIRAQDPK